eukprot:CAMPEP_0195282540 /NCGR_PEP_ID=MMETSP0707-20130614/1359_1 /TAXON_ID=33640 /ORGANISM="Asterionellopsis glacialis, Strain CCMP134" /LENGTH=624 /DNA_ID=CAMNT_0040341515 /DNA_START=85 /DNA_END=1959 /DNA_ORIENTATION=+
MYNLSKSTSKSKREEKGDHRHPSLTKPPSHIAEENIPEYIPWQEPNEERAAGRQTSKSSEDQAPTKPKIFHPSSQLNPKNNETITSHWTGTPNDENGGSETQDGSTSTNTANANTANLPSSSPDVHPGAYAVSGAQVERQSTGFLSPQQSRQVGDDASSSRSISRMQTPQRQVSTGKNPELAVAEAVFSNADIEAQARQRILEEAVQADVLGVGDTSPPQDVEQDKKEERTGMSRRRICVVAALILISIVGIIVVVAVTRNNNDSNSDTDKAGILNPVTSSPSVVQSPSLVPSPSPTSNAPSSAPSLAPTYSLTGTFVWFTTDGGLISDHSLVKMTTDGEIIFDVSFGQTGAVSVDPSDGSAWVPNLNRDEAIKFDGTGEEAVRVGGLRYGISATDPRDGSLWIALPNERILVKLDSDGNELFRTSAEDDVGISAAGAMMVNPNDGTLWVANRLAYQDPNSNSITRFNADNSEQQRFATGTGGFFSNAPAQLAVDPNNGSVWYVDSFGTSVRKLFPSGQFELRVDGFGENPLALAIDPQDSSLWVCSKESLVKIDQNGNILTKISFGDGQRSSYSVSVHPTDGTVWVGLQSGEMLKLTAGGEEITRIKLKEGRFAFMIQTATVE